MTKVCERRTVRVPYELIGLAARGRHAKFCSSVRSQGRSTCRRCARSDRQQFRACRSATASSRPARPRAVCEAIATDRRPDAAKTSYTIGPSMVRFLTAGESHGRALIVILEGIPAGLPIDIDAITADLKRRQGGYGRGRRMAIESDRADILSGVRRRNDRRSDRDVDRESRLGQLAAHDAHDQPNRPPDAGGAARAGHPTASGARRSGRRAKYGRTDSATSSSARARVKRRRG